MRSAFGRHPLVDSIGIPFFFRKQEKTILSKGVEMSKKIWYDISNECVHANQKQGGKHDEYCF